MKRTYMIMAVIAVIAVLAIASYFLLIKRNSVIECSSYSLDKCPTECVVCPPCEECSSISCQTKEYCKRMGFDREWYGKYVVK